ncbi:alpha/beta hydrolase [Primorskyibacter sp. 2E233]|uniref:alpha/beta hydrolase n=1 Tax=Primorskyibacter sp. 2E233 TaxID=3413431 RepID=UPI003BF23CE9
MSTLRDTLRGLLALPDPGDVPEGVQVNETTIAGGIRQDWLLNGATATLLCPDGASPRPTVLYCHAHGGDYTLGRRELIQGARWLTGPYAPDLLGLGLNVLCVDMPGFGDRQGSGSESALAKAGLWRGQPLMGRMLGDLQGAVSWLESQPFCTQIATLGMSMGAAHAYWLAALDPRISACAHLCMLADMAPLIETGTHDRHGHFLTVPGLLRHAEMGDVAALIAPRPQVITHGTGDHLTPPEARDPALERVHRAYATGGHLVTRLCEAETHIETPPMRAAVINFLRDWSTGALTHTQDQRKTG